MAKFFKDWLIFCASYKLSQWGVPRLLPCILCPTSETLWYSSMYADSPTLNISSVHCWLSLLAADCGLAFGHHLPQTVLSVALLAGVDLDRIFYPLSRLCSLCFQVKWPVFIFILPWTLVSITCGVMTLTTAHQDVAVFFIIISYLEERGNRGKKIKW